MGSNCIPGTKRCTEISNNDVNDTDVISRPNKKNIRKLTNGQQSLISNALFSSTYDKSENIIEAMKEQEN